MTVGLGCDASGKALFGEHDLVLPVNIEIDTEDFMDVNTLRNAMSCLLIHRFNEKPTSAAESDTFENLKWIKSKIFKILSKNRITLPTCYASNQEDNWEFHVKTETSTQYFNGGCQYPTISRPKLQRRQASASQELIRELDNIQNDLLA
jgi:hypothetical protein